MASIRKRTVQFAGLITIVALTVSEACAQISDTQDFTVTVTPELTITAPAGVTLTHDRTDANQAFAAQSWLVTQNASAGALVTFTTNQAFTNATASAKRDARIALVIASADPTAAWVVGAAADQTDYALADEVAAVSASSTAPGNATFDLTVTFLDTNFSVLPTGDYVTTVTGTITANP